jgi:hypothetical protein
MKIYVKGGGGAKRLNNASVLNPNEPNINAPP